MLLNPETAFSTQLLIMAAWPLIVLLALSVVAVAGLLLLVRKQRKKLRQARSYEHEHLFDQERLLHELINNMPDLIYVKDKQSKFLLTNKIHAELVGVGSPAEMIGKTDFDFYPEEMANNYFWSEKELITNKKPVINKEEVVVNKEGNKKYLSTTKIPLLDSNGACYGLVGIGRDITDRKKAEQSLVEHAEELQHVNQQLEEKQEEIFQQSEELTSQAEHLRKINTELEKLSLVARRTDNVVLILDRQGNIEWVNDSFTRVYGFTLDEFVKKRGRNLKQSSYNTDIQSIFEKCSKSREAVSYQSEAADKNGDEIWVQCTLTPVVDDQNNVIHYVAIDSDITSQKKAEELINNQKSEIESQRDLLQKLIATKDKFLSIIAHDLKNPFHSIIGFSDLLVKNASGMESGKQYDYIRLIHESANYAYGLLENLLQWSRTQSDRIKYDPVPVDLHRIVTDIQHVTSVAVENKSLRFSNDVNRGTMVFADKNMVNTIIRNLVNNAVKFTPEGGSVAVQAKEEGVRIKVSIRDTGIGIKDSDRKKIFSPEEFHTTSGTAGEAGTGLGLIICSEFIKRHGDELHIESSPDKGSTFSFSLPKKNDQKPV